MIDSCMVIPQNAALGGHTFVLEDGPVLPKEHGRHAEAGGEVLEEMYTPGCTSLEDTASRAPLRPSGIVSKV
jgi:hypothetical protein